MSDQHELDVHYRGRRAGLAVSIAALAVAIAALTVAIVR